MSRDMKPDWRDTALSVKERGIQTQGPDLDTKPFVNNSCIHQHIYA